jgi:serine protease Do
LHTAELRASALALGLILAGGAAADTDPAEVSRDRIERALAVIRPALVQLTVVSERFSEGRAVRYPSAGSGVIVSADGLVLTNYHVAGRSTRIQATLVDGIILGVDVVAHDPLTDLSVLRLQPRPDRASFAFARFAARAPEVGEPVLALGNPLTLASSVTLGIVSNTRRVFTDFTATQLEDLDLDGEPTGLFTQWLQHDALILPGNSGGPLVDLDGDIVGINELGGSGIGFAIPGRLAQKVLASALAEGRVRRSDLGFTVLPVAKLGRSHGALVASIASDTPAAKADLEPGDVVLSVNGEPVTVRFFEEVPSFYSRIADLAVGSEVELAIERGGATRRLRVATVELEPAFGAEAEVPRLGVTVQEITTSMARVRQIPPRAGLLITSVRAGSPAATSRPTINAGDVLTGFAGRAVRTVGDFESAVRAQPAGELLMELLRDDERLLTVGKLDDKPAARQGGELPKAWLGVQTQVVTPALARALATPDLRGFRISRVFPWTEAERAGLATGDVVTAVSGEVLEAEREQDAENLRHVVEEMPIGSAVELGLVRAGKALTVTVHLEPRPRDAGEAKVSRQEQLGFSVREVTLFDRVEFHWDRNQQGVLVTEVVPGGWSQMAGLEPNDLVLAIADRDVTDVKSFERELATTLEARPAVIKIFVRRGARTHFVFLEPDWDGAGRREKEKP